MLIVEIKKLYRVGVAAVVIVATCLLLIDIPSQLSELSTESPPTPGIELPRRQEIIAYSWARKLALDYRPSRECSVKNKTAVSSTTTTNTSKEMWLETIPGHLFLYTGHLDIRVVGYPSVRVIGVKREPTPLLYCTIWQENDEGLHSFSMEAQTSSIWLDEWGSTGDYIGILVTCSLPETVRPFNPSRVYVGPYSCYNNSSHTLSVKKVDLNNNNNNKREFTLCIKGLDFDNDISQKLVGFFELSRILGSKMFYVYVFNVHKNVTKVLELYEKSNVIRWFKFNLPGDLPNDKYKRRLLFKNDIWLKRRMELVPYNHCLYDNLYNSEYIIPIDIDEMIIPINKKTWTELLNNVKLLKNNLFNDYASYAVRNVYFFPNKQSNKFKYNYSNNNNFNYDNEFTQYLNTLRSSKISPEGDSVKSFVSTERTLIVHNHYALKTLNPSTKRVLHLDPKDVLKHHHRHNFMTNDLIVDTSALKYMKEFKARVKLFLSSF